MLVWPYARHRRPKRRHARRHRPAYAPVREQVNNDSQIQPVRANEDLRYLTVTVFLLHLINPLRLDRQRFANTRLGFLLCLILYYPAADRAHSDTHFLTDVRDAESLLHYYNDNFEFLAKIENPALPNHIISFEAELKTYQGIGRH